MGLDNPRSYIVQEIAVRRPVLVQADLAEAIRRVAESAKLEREERERE